MTRAELARRARLSRQHIVSLEEGAIAVPNRLTVEILAEVLEVLPEFLMQEPAPPPSRDVLHFRGGPRVSERSVDYLLARASVWMTVTDNLARRCLTLPKDSFASIDASGDIEDVALRARRAWGLGEDAPIDNVVRLMERAGAFVGTFDGGEKGVDAYSWQGARPLILCNSDRAAPSRTRFSLLHEAGHLIRHRGRKTGDAETEEEANRFASSLLLPRRAFWQEFPRFGSRLNWPEMFKMKARWGASIAAIVRRAYDLAIITPSQYKTANIALSANGWRKGEPGEPDAAEQPEMTPAIVKSVAVSLKHGALTSATGLYAKTICALTDADVTSFDVPQTKLLKLSPPARSL